MDNKVEWLMKTPLKKNLKQKEYNQHYNSCIDKGDPFAVFSSRKKHGTYKLDLFPIAGDYFLTEEGNSELRGAFSAFLCKWWYVDDYGMDGIIYSTPGKHGILTVDPCPVGEEDYVHKTVCHIIGRHLGVAE